MYHHVVHALKMDLLALHVFLVILYLVLFVLQIVVMVTILLSKLVLPSLVGLLKYYYVSLARGNVLLVLVGLLVPHVMLV